MPEYHEKLCLPSNLNREEIKNHVISSFLEEEAGTGKGDKSSKYIYEVEDSLNRKIFLRRPANLNKGMDFTVHVEGIKFREKYAFKNRPKHQEIIDDLVAKKNSDPVSFVRVSEVLEQIYQCEHFEPEELQKIDIKAGLLTCEEVCLTVKWLFIEQDVTYWNWSGRAMFYNALKSNNLL